MTPTRRAWSDPQANTVAANECDTNVDTSWLGKNFICSEPLSARLMSSMLIAPLSSRLRMCPLFPARRTAYDDPVSGDTFILVFNKSLYFGEKLDHTLINSNQIRAYGIPLWDNPYDPSCALNIEVSLDLHIPLQMFGTKVTFRTCVPTAYELHSCQHIQMNSARPWNPSDVLMIQGTDQGGSRSRKRQLSSVNAAVTDRHEYEYLDADIDEALLESIDPSTQATSYVVTSRNALRTAWHASTQYFCERWETHKVFDAIDCRKIWHQSDQSSTNAKTLSAVSDQPYSLSVDNIAQTAFLTWSAWMGNSLPMPLTGNCNHYPATLDHNYIPISVDSRYRTRFRILMAIVWATRWRNSSAITVCQKTERLMVHPYRRDRRRDSWMRFEDMKLNIMFLDPEGQLRILLNRAFTKSKCDGTASCSRRRSRRDCGTMNLLEYVRRRIYAPTCRNMLKVIHPLRLSRVRHSASQSIWTLSFMIGFCFAATLDWARLSWVVG